MLTPEKTTINIGFVPLTDCAPLVVAKEMGFFEQVGLQVELQKQNSWATLRDKLHAGVIDAAHMLAPMPLASTLGLGCPTTDVIAPMILSFNGNAITLSNSLQNEITKANKLEALPRPMRANLLKEVCLARRLAGKEKLTFATVFPYSCHYYQLLDWLKQGGVSVNDVEIVVIPPVNMVAFLESGEIDGFCVGGPWNAKAVRSRIGTTVVTSFDIWPDTPEKVLGVLSVWQERYPQSLVAICVALLRACQYLMTIPNRFEAARLLTKQRYLDEPLDVIAPSMLGSCLVTEHEPPREIPQYNQFSLDSQPALNRPNWQSATQLLSHMVDAGQICRESVDAEQLQHIYRDDVFAQAQRFTS